MHFQNLADSGYLLDQIPHDLHQRLCHASEEIQQRRLAADEFNDKLAGHLVEEYEFPRVPGLESYLYSLVNHYAQRWPNYLDEMDFMFEDLPVTLGPLWINYQRKHEYNPPHNHSGVFSFVIWVKIPYDLEQEQSLWKKPINGGVNSGCFQFLYNTGWNRIHTWTLPTDRQFEGKCCLFPAGLMHTVFPFYTSDEPRISISGNFKLGDSSYEWPRLDSAKRT